MRLLRSPYPCDLENMPAYILSLSEANGYDRPSWITGLLNERRDGDGNSLSSSDLYLRQSAFVPGIEAITGVPRSLLESITDYADKEVKSSRPVKYRIFSTWIDSQYLNFAHFKICSKCISETGIINRLWSIIPLTACPRHNVLLLDRCPACSKHLSWQRAKVVECQCGYDLRDATVSVCNKGDADLSAMICAFFAKNTGHCTDPNVRIKNPIFSLALTDMLSLLLFTARYLRDQAEEKKKFNISAYGNSELHSLLSRATDVYRHWPKNYFRFIDDLRNRHRETREATGFRKDFGKYHFYLYRDFNGSQYAFLRNAFEKYIASWSGGYLKPNSHLKSVLNKSEYVTARQAAEFLRIKHQRIPELVKQGLLKGNVQKMGSKTLCLVDARSVKEFKTTYSESLNLHQSARLLGTSTNNVIEMIKNKNLDALHGSATESGGKWKITRSSINLLIRRLSEKTTVRGSDRHSSKYLYGLQKAALHLRISSADLVKAVFDGDICPREKNAGKRLENFVFLRKELDDYKSKELQDCGTDTMTIEQVRYKLNARNLDVVYFLVRKGLLNAEKMKNGRARILRISQEEFERFSSAFVHAAEVARNLKTCSRHVVALLRQHGSLPISGPKVDGGPAYWVKKGDVTRFLYLNQKTFKQAYKSALMRSVPCITSGAKTKLLPSHARMNIPQNKTKNAMGKIDRKISGFH